ncbi:MAG: hypothetical protein IAB19_01635 [Proteobacteria bacterium]|uniref:Uncharacterized protein n=1 Tax=Candidatus Avisuccinivibrio stercorigallinarum TaxID=2840704 RepID=A0A9D9D9X6_9GAMM|nr:hypothetical protein [Candidatus Avisuccinivibrio stercorigallinarum]
MKLKQIKLNTNTSHSSLQRCVIIKNPTASFARNKPSLLSRASTIYSAFALSLSCIAGTSFIITAQAQEITVTAFVPNQMKIVSINFGNKDDDTINEFCNFTKPTNSPASCKLDLTSEYNICYVMVNETDQSNKISSFSSEVRDIEISNQSVITLEFDDKDFNINM